jgi:Peptidoglycan-binding protein, CsiV
MGMENVARRSASQRIVSSVLCLGFAGGMCLSDSCLAGTSDTTFNVELVVFRYNGTVASPENWNVAPSPLPSSVPSPSGAAPPNQSFTSTPDTIRPLNPAQFQLSGTETTLRRNSIYVPLAHFGFRLVAGEREAGTAVRIEPMVDAASGLSGAVTLERGRFLHLALDLTYTTADPPAKLLAAGAQPGPLTFQMHQDRRMRLFERHYFDHPAFGVVAIITPVITNSGAGD